MMNLLANIAPQSGGRALFSARPATPLPNETADVARFDEALRIAQGTVSDIVVATADDDFVAGQEPKAETTSAGDQEERDAERPADAQPLSPLPGLAPSSVETPAMTVTTAAEVPTVASTAPASAPMNAMAPITPATSSATPAAAPAMVAGIQNDASPASGHARPARAAIGTQSAAMTVGAATTVGAAMTVADESVAALPVASAVRGGSKESTSVSGVAERAMVLLASQPQPQHSPATMPTIAIDPLAANGANQPGIVQPGTAQPGAVARQPLAALLGEQLHVQINQRSEHAVIRLDPPSMGTIEITIRHEAGAVHVQMRASNVEVTRQLHAIGDTLRQDLGQRQHSDVSVQMWDGSRDAADGRQRQRHAALWQADPGRALGDASDSHEPAAFTLDA